MQQVLHTQVSDKSLIPDHAISWSYSAMFNKYPGIQFGYEHKLHSSLSLELDIAYLSRYEGRENQLNGSGTRVKVGAKIPLGVEQIRFQIHYFYRYHQGNIEEYYGRFNNIFFQFIEHQRVTHLHGLAVGISSFSRYGPFDFEAGFSVGPGVLIAREDDLPADAIRADFRGIFSVFEEAGSYFYPIISLQAKIKYPF